jgi:uncharacterized membrane protein YfcA
MQLLVGLLLSAGIGLSLGLIGGGGSIVTVPVLVYVLGVDVHEAIAMSLAVVGVTSAVGAFLHHRNGAVHFKAGSLFGASGVVGALFGARLTYLVSPGALLLMFAALMFVAAALMLIRRSGASGAPRRPSVWRAATAGLVVGALTGFLGVGGGFLIVPALSLFGGLDMRAAVGTSLVVIAINCAAGLVGHAAQGGFDPGIASAVAALATVGALAGSSLSRRVSPEGLKTGFALFVLAVAVFLVARNYSALL